MLQYNYMSCLLAAFEPLWTDMYEDINIVRSVCLSPFPPAESTAWLNQWRHTHLCVSLVSLVPPGALGNTVHLSPSLFLTHSVMFVLYGIHALCSG